MTLWGYQVDLDAYVYSNVYVTPIHLHRKRKEKKKCNRVWRQKNHNKDWFYLNNQIDISYNSPTHAHV